MKKMVYVLVVLMLMASIAPLTFADEAVNSTDEIEIDVETQKQIEIMNTTLGTQIRLLQLEKAIIKNMLIGEEVVSFLTELEYNTTELEAILAEFELLKEEVISADANEANAVHIFVDLKYDAIYITKDFRETLKGLFENETIEQIRERIKNMICEKVQNLTKYIHNKIKQFNRNQLNIIYPIIGENGEYFLNKYHNGTLSMEQIKNNISKTVSMMTKEKRYDIFYQLKQNKIKSRIRARICVENATENFLERQQNRLKSRIQKAENMSDDTVSEEMQERIRNRLSGYADDSNSGNGNCSGTSSNVNDDSGNSYKQQSGGGGS